MLPNGNLNALKLLSASRVLSENDEILDISKCSAFTESYLPFQINDKKVSSKLYSALRDIAETNFLQDYRSICVQISSFISKLNAESDCPISCEEEIDMTALFKVLGVNIESGDTLLEKLLMYIRVKSCFLGIRCFFFVNLKTFLTAKELEMFYHEAELMEICIFLLENTFKPKLACERVVIIDNDLCEILA